MRLLACFLMLLPITLIAGAETPLIPRQVIFGNPEKAAPQISPNGNKLAYLAPDTEQVLNVWIRDLNKQESSQQDQLVTSDKKRGIRCFHWQYDNEHILYIQDKDGDENWHLYQTNLLTKNTRDLTPFEGVRAMILTYEPDYPNEILVELNLRDRALFDVYRINLKNGAVELDTLNMDNVHTWLADRKLTVRAAQSYTQEGDTLIRVRDNMTTPWRNLMQWGPEESHEHFVSFSPDGEDMHLITSFEAPAGRLIKVSLASGKTDVIATDPEYDLSEVMINPITYQIDAVGVERDRLNWIVINDSLSADFAKLKRDDAIFRVMSRDLADNQWVINYIFDNKAPAFYLYNRNTKKSEYLFTTRPLLEKYELSKMTPISYQARDGMTIHGYLTLPVKKELKGLSAVLFIHGGPWVRDSWGFNPTAQLFANRGYAVLQINYRGSSGYGKQFLNAGKREWGGKMHTDLIDGKEWLIKQGYVNPDKIAIYGGSYGGYAALAGLTFTPNEFCCAVDFFGPSNLVSLLQTLPPYWGPAKAIFDQRVGNVETEQPFLQSRSPLSKVDQIIKPLLIAQGANDPRVKQSESDQIVSAMRSRNKPVEYLLFSDEGHGFMRPGNQLKFFAAVEHFFTKFLGGRNQPPAPEDDWKSLLQ